MLLRLSDLCQQLHMPQQVTEDILSAYQALDWETVLPAAALLRRQEHWDEGLQSVKALLGEDPDGIRMLTCQLLISLQTRKHFREVGLSDRIFLATMDCFPRFVREHMESFGRYGFDREWWTVRQLSGVLFRIGLLEFELSQGKVCLHIPSGANLVPEQIDASLAEGRRVIGVLFPAWKDLPYVCHSWLLSPTLKQLLPESSRILQFQNRFDTCPTGSDDNDFLVWVFKNKDIPLAQLPEHTSLQRKLKAYLLQGGVFQDTRGTLRQAGR